MKLAIGEKIEMSQHFLQDGTVIPVTLIRVDENIVSNVKTVEKDGYSAVQVGSGHAKHVAKPQESFAKQFGPLKTVREFRVAETDLKLGDKFDVSSFAVGDKVDVVGFSKGRGFQGVVKRHGFHGQDSTHGHKDQERMPGSIGAGGVQRVRKGTRMGGRMGADRVTVKNLEVVNVDSSGKILAIKGAVPGARGGLILIRSHERKSIWQK